MEGDAYTIPSSPDQDYILLLLFVFPTNQDGRNPVIRCLLPAAIIVLQGGVLVRTDDDSMVLSSTSKYFGAAQHETDHEEGE